MSEPSDGLFTIKCECGVIYRAENRKCTCEKTQGELNFNVPRFLTRLYALSDEGEKSGKTDKGIDLIFDVFFNLHDRFDIMNEILGQVDVNKLTSSPLYSMMSRTFKYSPQIPNHIGFVDRVEARYRELGMDEKRIHNLVDKMRGPGDYWKTMETLGAPIWISGPKP